MAGCTTAQSASYYMRSDGTAANKTAASGPCSKASACMDESTHNRETFSAGDVIILYNENGDYTSTIISPSDGFSGQRNKILF